MCYNLSEYLLTLFSVQALVDCLAAESKSVEAKLQVLTAALAYYTDLRPSHEAIAAEADALGHYLFMYDSLVA